MCSRHLGHLTKMAATPIYGKNPSKVLSGTSGLISNETLYVLGTQAHHSLFKSSSYLQVTMVYIRACVRSSFGQIPPLTMELAALECLRNRCHDIFSVDIDLILFKLVV